MTARCGSKKQCLTLGSVGDEQREEENTETVEKDAGVDGDKDEVSTEPVTLTSQVKMTNNETTADLASNITVASSIKCNADKHKVFHLSTERDGICDDGGHSIHPEETFDNKDVKMSCCKTQVFECETNAPGFYSNRPEDLNSTSNSNTPASFLGQSLSDNSSPLSKRASSHCNTRLLSDVADMSTPESCSFGHFSVQRPNLEEKIVALKKSQDKGNVISRNESKKNNCVTSYRSVNFESRASVSPDSCEGSLGSSSISISTFENVAPASAQSADSDRCSSRIFTPDVASVKAICTRACVAGWDSSTSQIQDYPRRFNQDSLSSPGSQSQHDDNNLITFSRQHNNNNCSLSSTYNDVSLTCGVYEGGSDVVSSTRNDSKDIDGQVDSQRDAQLLDDEQTHSSHDRDICDRGHDSRQLKVQKVEGRKSSNERISGEVKDDRYVQASDAATRGQGHLLQYRRGHHLQEGQLLSSNTFQAFNSPTWTASRSAVRYPLRSESSISCFSLSSSHSSPAIVNAEGNRLPLQNTDINDVPNKYTDVSQDDRDDREDREDSVQTRHKSASIDTESSTSQPVLFAESTCSTGRNSSRLPSPVTGSFHPLIQRSGFADSSTIANAGFPESSTTGHRYMRFQGSNDNPYSHLSNPCSYNQLPDTSRSVISRSDIQHLFHRQEHGVSPYGSLRKCFSCNNVDVSHAPVQSATRQQATRKANHGDMQSENEFYPETTGHSSEPGCPETEDANDSSLSGLADAVALVQNINVLRGPVQEEPDDHQRSILFLKDEQNNSTHICEDNNYNDSNRFTRLGRHHREDLPHSGISTADTPNTSISNSTSSACMAQVYTEAQLSLEAPAIRITTSTLSVDSLPVSATDKIHQSATSSTSSSPASTAEIYVAANGSHKPRVSFINGLRRLSREKTAFLRVEQPCSHILRSPSSVAQCVDKRDDYEPARVGKRFGTENKRRLKVEFAIMETDSEKLALNKGTGSLSRGLVSIKDDVENDVAMLGGGGGRFRHPRVSLLGKPLNYKAHRRDISYRRLQARIYNFLERPKSWQSWIYHLTMFLFVLLCLTLGVLSSITEFENILLQYAVYLEIVMLLWIVLELGLRVWSAGCRSRYQGKSGRLRFLRRPLCIIDMILVMASISSLIVGSTQEHFSQAVLSGLRFFQILRMVRMDRKGGTWKLLGSVVWAHRQELVTTLYIGLLGLVFSSYFVYLAEKDEPRLENGVKNQFNNTVYKPKFSNFADAIWWGVVTLCTVGYGDVVPATWGGKVIASFSAILGISFFALPAGILGSGFALKVQQQQRQKHLNRRRIPAANLIQCLWRCYAADELSMSTATWKPHLIPCPSPPSERTFKNNTSFVSRFSTRRRDRGNATGSFSRDGVQSHSPMSARHHCRRSAISTSEEEVTNVMDRSHLSLATGATEQKYQLDTIPFRKENSVTSIGKESEEEDLSPRLTQLTEQHKRIIRVIRKIRYFVSRRKFREALRPYDVKDVIEQYSAGHIDMLARIKNLQGRLDQILGRQGSKGKDVYESKICLASRIVKVERQVEDIETKLDMLLDMYKEDRKLLLQHLSLSQKGTIQAGPTHPPPPPPASSSQFKPRPILIDKQFTSEPATPTGIGYPGSPRGRLHGIKPVIQRNLSDLSQRIKKRVTYRGLYLQDPPSRAQSAANFSSIQPSHFPLTTPVIKSTSPDELSSTTMSEATRDESSENIISLNEIDSSLTFDIKTNIGVSKPEASSCAQAGSSDSTASLLNTEETYFFSNSNVCPGLKGIQQMPISASPVNSPLMRAKTLSTLNEQLSLESDTSQSCASSSPPTPPTNKTVAGVVRTTPPSSVQQSPLIESRKRVSGTDSSAECQISSPSSSRRPQKPILRLPSSLASTAVSSESYTTTNIASPQRLTPTSAFPSNYVNSTHNVLFQTEDTSKLCSMEEDSTEIAGVTNRSCRTSEL